MNKEDFVSYEIAQALKKAGFDWECYEFWDTSFCDDGTPIKTRKTTQGPRTCVMSERNSILESIGGDLITAPTMALAQKWLREVHGIHIAVIGNYDCGGSLYAFEVWLQGVSGGRQVLLYETKKLSDHESALLAGIEAALKLIEEGER